jgi:hypothetical protein
MYYSLVAYCTTLTVQTSHHQSSEVEINLIILDVPPFATSRSREILVAKGGTMWARNFRGILLEMPDFHVPFKVLLHAVNLRHGTDGFHFPSEGRRAEDFFARKKSDGFGLRGTSIP